MVLYTRPQHKKKEDSAELEMQKQERDASCENGAKQLCTAMKAERNVFK